MDVSALIVRRRRSSTGIGERAEECLEEWNESCRRQGAVIIMAQGIILREIGSLSYGKKDEE